MDYEGGHILLHSYDMTMQYCMIVYTILDFSYI